MHAIEDLKTSPPLRSPDDLADNILYAVHRSHFKNTGVVSFFDGMIEALSRSTVRFAMGGAVILLLGIFVVQEAIILRRIDMLERRLTQQRAVGESPLTLLANEAQLLRSLNNGGDEIIIDRKTLEKLLTAFDNLQLKNKLLLKLFEEKTLSTAGVSLDDGLTGDELQKLLQDKTVLQKIHNL